MKSNPTYLPKLFSVCNPNTHTHTHTERERDRYKYLYNISIYLSIYLSIDNTTVSDTEYIHECLIKKHNIK